jgi:hypothetical protein
MLRRLTVADNWASAKWKPIFLPFRVRVVILLVAFQVLSLAVKGHGMPFATECPGFRWQQRLSRRQMLSIGGAAGLGLSLPDLFRLRATSNAAESAGSFGAAKSVIFIFLHGGHPQHETWDPKPQAPAEVRGEFGDIATAVPGLRISELLPRCAQIADRLTIVRSLSHDNPNHVQACLPAMTGHTHPPQVRGRGDFPPSPTDFPHYGAVMDHLRPAQRPLPNWVQIGPQMTRSNGTVLHGQAAGFLGSNHSPFIVDQNLLAAEVRVEAASPQIGVSRMQGRQQLLDEIESQRRRLDVLAATAKDSFYQRAFHLLTSDATQRAFDLSAEPQSMREKYPQNQVGQSCLLARRLVEAGVPFVNVHYCKTPSGSWDTHGNNFKQMKDSLGPTLDHALSALVLDLEQRGLLDQVLVVATAEFGRTPQINRSAGRDHWPWVYSIALAGAGLQHGAVYGESDRLAAYPQSTPHDPADMAATYYHLLGVPPSTIIYDPSHRPHQVIVGRAIQPILA